MVNSFQTPISTYEGFSMNPAYMTPSYMAAFRPGFEPGRPGQNPYEVRMSNAQAFSVMTGLSDIAPDADTNAEQDAAISTIMNTPGDIAATGFSKYAAPALGFAAAHYALNKTGIMSGLMGKVAPFMGRAAGSVAGGLAGAGIRTGFTAGSMATGYGMRAGLTANLPRAFSAGGLASGFAKAGGAIGALSVPFIAPMATIAAGSMLSDGLLASTVDPYIATRKGTLAMQANTLRQFVGGQGGSATGSLGVSATRAAQIAASASEIGAEDWALNSEDVNRLTDAGMRSGLFSNIGDLDTDKMAKGIRGMMSTIKAVVAMGAAIDDMGAIDLMSKMKAAGLHNFRDMSIVSSQLSGAAAISGVSVEQLMTTVGNRSQMNATQRGILPILGQVQAANAYAGIQNAHKAGILSSGQMAALGGVEGMTSSTLDSAFNALDSDMGQMAMQTGLGINASGLDIMVAAGERYAENPYGYEGLQVLNSGANMSEVLRKKSTHQISVESVLRDTKLLSPAAFNKDGRIEVSKLWPAAQALGMTPTDFRTMAETIRINQDEASNFRIEEAADAHNRRRFVAEMDRHGYSMIGSPLGEVQRGWKGFKETAIGLGTSLVTPINTDIASISDTISEALSSASGVVTPRNAPMRLDEEGPEYRLRESPLGRMAEVKKLYTLARGKGALADKARELIAMLPTKDAGMYSGFDGLVGPTKDGMPLSREKLDRTSILDKLWELDTKGAVSGARGTDKISALEELADRIVGDDVWLERIEGTSKKELSAAKRERLEKIFKMDDISAMRAYGSDAFKYREKPKDIVSTLSDSEVDEMFSNNFNMGSAEDIDTMFDSFTSLETRKLLAGSKADTLTPAEAKRLRRTQLNAKAMGVDINELATLSRDQLRKRKSFKTEVYAEKVNDFQTDSFDLVGSNAKLSYLIDEERKLGRIPDSISNEQILTRIHGSMDNESMSKALTSLTKEDSTNLLSSAITTTVDSIKRFDPAIIVQGQLKDIMGSNNQQLGKNNDAVSANTKALDMLRAQIHETAWFSDDVTEDFIPKPTTIPGQITTGN